MALATVRAITENARNAMALPTVGVVAAMRTVRCVVVPAAAGIVTKKDI